MNSCLSRVHMKIMLIALSITSYAGHAYRSLPQANFNDKYDEHSKKWVVGSWAQNPKPKPRPKKGFLPRKLLRE